MSSTSPCRPTRPVSPISKIKPDSAPNPRPKIFDPWNSSSTGHQRAENGLAGSTSWRHSRTMKLGHQFRSGLGGGRRIYDTVGAGSRNFGKDGRKENGAWEIGAKGMREKGWQDVKALLGGETKTAVASPGERDEKMPMRVTPTVEVEEEAICKAVGGEDEQEIKNHRPSRTERKIFQGLCVYINGSTAPTVSDHKLKFLLAENGARVSIALGRRSVTHVILGTPSALGGAGGGLASSKIQKEIRRVGGCGVKYVGVDWVMESIKAGNRLPEAQFANMSTASKGQKSVYGIFKNVGGLGGEKDKQRS